MSVATETGPFERKKKKKKKSAPKVYKHRLGLRRDLLLRPLERFIIINHFYIALFSALEQTHCARM